MRAGDKNKIFSSFLFLPVVFLTPPSLRATSPIFLPYFFNPLVLRALPLYFALQKHPAMLRDTAREDCATKDFLSLPKKVLVTLIRFICSFFSTARRTNQEAPPLLSGFWVRRYGRRRGLRNSLRSDSPRPFSSVFLTTSPTDKGGDFARAFASLFNPLALRALPLYSFQEHRGRGGLPLLSPLRVFLRPLLIAMLLGSPLYFAAQKHPAMLRDTGEEGEMYFPFASAPIL